MKPGNSLISELIYNCVSLYTRSPYTQQTALYFGQSNAEAINQRLTKKESRALPNIFIISCKASKSMSILSATDKQIGTDSLVRTK